MAHSPVDVIDNGSPRPTAMSVSNQGRLIDRVNPTVVNVLTVVGFGLPVLGYFYLLSRYSVNVVFADQWDDVPVIHQSYVHFFDWSSLWSPHNENRILFPNIIVVLLAHTVHYNIQVEEYLSAIMLMVATSFLIWAHKRRSPQTPWLYYCPVVLLTLSIVQWENTLWGFQMAWYLVLLSLAAAIVLLDRVKFGWLAFSGAVIVAVIGSFSSLQGLIIWPIGLLLIYHRRRSLSVALIWIVTAVVTVAIYFHDFSGAAGPAPNLAWRHPFAAIEFFLYALGEVVDLPTKLDQPENLVVLLFGVVIVVLALVTILMYGIRRDERGGSPIGVALICFGLLFAAFITQGRLFFGADGASQSRYTTFDLLVLVGIYLAILERPRRSSKSIEPALTAERKSQPVDRTPILQYLTDWAARIGLSVMRWVVIIAIAVQFAVGIHYGLAGARANYDSQVADVKILRNISHTSDITVRDTLYFAKTSGWIRMQVRVLEEHDLSLFHDTGQGGS
jgi:hypothetical protein